MRTHFFAASLLAGFVFAPWGTTAALAQDHSSHGAPAAAMACCAAHDQVPATGAKPMACCDHHKPVADATPMPCCDRNDPKVASAGLGFPVKPEVQTLVVTFREPVRVTGAILMGRYVIQHDDARMARGEPCTYIFEAAERRMPLITFHCTHLERQPSETAIVVLRPGKDSGMKQLAEFQFAGDDASHGAPAIR